LMTKARDIGLMGLGLVAGMVLGYFIAAEPSLPQMAGGVTMPLAGTAPPATTVIALPEILLEEFNSRAPVVLPERPTLENWRQPLIDRPRPADFIQHKPTQFIPAPGVYNSPRGQWQNFSPGGPSGPQYDLIDFKYVPDFRLPVN